MEEREREERNVEDSARRNVLTQPDLLRHVFSFAPKSHLFCSAVARAWTHEHCNAEPETAFAAVVESVGRVVWAMEACRDLTFDDDRLVRAAANAGGMGVDILDWAARRGLLLLAARFDAPADAAAVAAAAAAAHGFRFKTTWERELCAWAAKAGNVGLLRWIKRNGLPWRDARTTAAAAAGGHLSLLQWLRARGCPWGAETCAGAAGAGHIAVLQWLRTNGCPWGRTTTAAAALAGNSELIRWARANGCPWGPSTCQAAAQGGHLALLQWLRRNGCEWDQWCCHAAAHAGNLEVLRWARANGCAWDRSTCFYAQFCGDRRVLEFVHDNGCPCRHQQDRGGGEEQPPQPGEEGLQGEQQQHQL